MFGTGFFIERRARRAAAAATAAIGDAFAGQSAHERAAIMAISNAILASVASQHGDLVLTRPAALKRSTVSTILAELSTSLSKLSAVLDALSDREHGDPVLDGVHRQMRATELVVATLGISLDPKAKSPVLEAWRTLYKARRHAGEAVAALTAFREETGTSPVPEGVPSGRGDLLAMATTPPPFLVAKARTA
jgi:hypothetical protein